VVEPDLAMQQRDADIAKVKREGKGDEDPDDDGDGGDGGKGAGGTREGGGGYRPGGKGAVPRPPQPTRYFGSIELDPHFPARDFATIQ
ncbi:hypothetical protein K4H00_23505, partial [Mycobacterium tuberculosis]|nr:hypothetical protein [Mycobacterium tuberculosis]